MSLTGVGQRLPPVSEKSKDVRTSSTGQMKQTGPLTSTERQHANQYEPILAKDGKPGLSRGSQVKLINLIANHTPVFNN